MLAAQPQPHCHTSSHTAGDVCLPWGDPREAAGRNLHTSVCGSAGYFYCCRNAGSSFTRLSSCGADTGLAGTALPRQSNRSGMKCHHTTSLVTKLKKSACLPHTLCSVPERRTAEHRDLPCSEDRHFEAAAACCVCSQLHYSYRARSCFRSQQLQRENASQAAPHSSSPSSPIISTGLGPAAHSVQALCCWGQRALRWADEMPDPSGSDLSKIWRLLYSLEDSLAFAATRRADIPCRTSPRLGTSLPFSNGREEQFRDCFYSHLQISPQPR